MKAEIRRDHMGRLHLYANGEPVAGALVNGMRDLGATLGICAEVYIPTVQMTFGEVDNVVPFRRASG